jgi:hypothetical protein
MNGRKGGESAGQEKMLRTGCRGQRGRATDQEQ